MIRSIKGVLFSLTFSATKHTPTTPHRVQLPHEIRFVAGLGLQARHRLVRPLRSLAMGLARGAATPRQLVPRPRSLARCCPTRPPQSLAGASPRELAQLAVDCRCLARPLSESRACRRSPARLPKAAPRSIVRSPPRELVRPSHTRIRRTGFGGLEWINHR